MIVLDITPGQKLRDIAKHKLISYLPYQENITNEITNVFIEKNVANLTKDIWMMACEEQIQTEACLKKIETFAEFRQKQLEKVKIALETLPIKLLVIGQNTSKLTRTWDRDMPTVKYVRTVSRDTKQILDILQKNYQSRLMKIEQQLQLSQTGKSLLMMIIIMIIIIPMCTYT